MNKTTPDYEFVYKKFLDTFYEGNNVGLFGGNPLRNQIGKVDKNV